LPENDSAAEEMRRAVIQELEDVKAEDIVTIGLSGKSDIADYMIVATGRSQRQVGAAAERVRKAAKELTSRPVALEGAPACDWVLIDTGDVVVHIFRPEVREFYNLEKMWSAQLPLDASDSNTIYHPLDDTPDELLDEPFDESFDDSVDDPQEGAL